MSFSFTKGVDYIEVDEDLKLPFVSLKLVEYLKSIYSLPYLLSNSNKAKTNDEHIGYIKGVQEVLTQLEILSKAGEKDVF